MATTGTTMSMATRTRMVMGTPTLTRTDPSNSGPVGGPAE